MDAPYDTGIKSHITRVTCIGVHVLNILLLEILVTSCSTAHGSLCPTHSLSTAIPSARLASSLWEARSEKSWLVRVCLNSSIVWHFKIVSVSLVFPLQQTADCCSVYLVSLSWFSHLSWGFHQQLGKCCVCVCLLGFDPIFIICGLHYLC
jgi:hypothetical protein